MFTSFPFGFSRPLKVVKPVILDTKLGQKMGDEPFRNSKDFPTLSESALSQESRRVTFNLANERKRYVLKLIM